MLVPWLVVKVVLTAAVLGLIGGGSFVITEHSPPPLAVTRVVPRLVEERFCNRTDCSDHGDCQIINGTGLCTCDDLYYGGVCQLSCPGLCSGVGTCQFVNETTNLTSLFVDDEANVTCACPRSRAGGICEVECPLNCSGNGRCHSNSVCECDIEFTGRGCEVPCDYCGLGHCDPEGLCICDGRDHYGPNCSLEMTTCNITGGANSKLEKFFGQFPEGCDENSTYYVNLTFLSTENDFYGEVNVTNVSFVELESFGQIGLGEALANGSLGTITFTYPYARSWLVFRAKYSSGREQNFSMQIDTIKAVAGGGGGGGIRPNCITNNCQFVGEGNESIQAHFPSKGDSTDNTFFLFDGSWEPAVPHFNTLRTEAYFRPDMVVLDASNQFAVILGWFTILVAILCGIAFIGVCVRRPPTKEIALSQMQGGFYRVWLYELKSRHAIVGMRIHSSNSLWDIPSKFLLLFLNTFVNLALCALWLGQHSVGEMISSTLITAVSVFVLMQLLRLCLRGAHLQKQWYHVVLSYTAPLALAVWSAYTTGLFILSMTEDEAEYFLIRAVCSFFLQHTLFISLSTAILVLIQQSRNRNTANTGVSPLP